MQQIQIYANIALVTKQLLELRVLSNLLMRFCLNLTNPLACNTKLSPHLLERMHDPVHQTMSHLENLALLWREIAQNLLNLI